LLIDGGENIRINNTTIWDVRRQQGAAKTIGEGVGLLIGVDTKNDCIIDNVIEFVEDKLNDTIGIWLGEGSRVDVTNNVECPILEAEFWYPFKKFK
jgi:hypothetical protein